MKIKVEVIAPSIQLEIDGDSDDVLGQVRKLQQAFTELDLPDLTVSILEIREAKPEPRLANSALIEDLELSVRTYNVLKREGVVTVGDLTSRTRESLEAIQFLGGKSVDEIIDVLDSFGLKLETR